MMCCTLDDVLYIELVAELSVNIIFKHIIVQPLGSGVTWRLFAQCFTKGGKGIQRVWSWLGCKCWWRNS